MSARKTTQYTIVSAAKTEDLILMVNRMISDGWTITGMPFFGDKRYHQAMVMLEPHDGRDRR